MPRSRFSNALIVAVLVLGFLTLVGVSEVRGQPPVPEDFFATVSGESPDGTYVSFGNGIIPPIPADFFGPGSDPFVGQVSLGGSLLGPMIWGDGSTLAQRSDHAVPPEAPPGAMGTVDIEIVALSLLSTQPIAVTYDGGAYTELWDLRVQLSPDLPPPGQLTVTKTHENGGIFDTFFYVQPLFTFTNVVDEAERFLDTGLEGLPPLAFEAIGTPWVHAKDPSVDILAPSDGWFVPCVGEFLPGDPTSQEAVPMPALEFSGAARHTVFPARSLGPPPPPDPMATIAAGFPDGSWMKFGGGGAIPPLPAGFFGPGSDPFEGQVALEGLPIDSENLADASTLVQRSANPFSPETLPGPTRVIDVEIVELNLVSTEPIVVTYGGVEPELWDLQVLLSPTVPPPGELAVTKTHENGGIFHADFGLQPLFVFTRVADGTELVRDTADMGMPPLQFEMAWVPWVHVVNPILQFVAPSDGWFVPGVEEYYPGYPESQEGHAVVALEVSGSAQHTIFPARHPILPDPHATISGEEPGGSFVRFGFGIIPPIPADYFGPGSDPFEGQIALDGNPFDTPAMGDTSTLAQRSGHPILPIAPPGGSGTVDIEIIALDLVSTQPIVVTYNGGSDPEPFDVRVLLSPTAPAPPGQLTATKTHVNGGTYDLFFQVQPLFVFTRVMDGTEFFLDTAWMMPPLQFQTFLTPWVYDMNPALGFLAPSDGWFVPGIQELLPGDLESQVGVRTVIEEVSGAARHTIFPARPSGTAVGEVPAVSLSIRSFPNPFNPSTQIEFYLPRGGQAEVGIYDLSGRLIHRLASGIYGPGTHSVPWHGTDHNGKGVASGVYLYRVTTPGAMVTEKGALVK